MKKGIRETATEVWREQFPTLPHLYVFHDYVTVGSYVEKFRAYCSCGAIYRGTAYTALKDPEVRNTETYEYDNVHTARENGVRLEPYLDTPHTASCTVRDSAYEDIEKRELNWLTGKNWHATDILYEVLAEGDRHLRIIRSANRIRIKDGRLEEAVHPLLERVIGIDGQTTETVYRMKRGRPVGEEKELTREELHAEMWRYESDMRDVHIDPSLVGTTIWEETGIQEWLSFTKNDFGDALSRYLTVQHQSPLAIELVRSGYEHYVEERMKQSSPMHEQIGDEIPLPAEHLQLLVGDKYGTITAWVSFYQQEPFAATYVEWLNDIGSVQERQQIMYYAVDLVSNHGYRPIELFDYLATVDHRQAIVPLEAVKKMVGLCVIAERLGETMVGLRYPASIRLQQDLFKMKLIDNRDFVSMYHLA